MGTTGSSSSSSSNNSRSDNSNDNQHPQPQPSPPSSEEETTPVIFAQAGMKKEYYSAVARSSGAAAENDDQGGILHDDDCLDDDEDDEEEALSRKRIMSLPNASRKRNCLSYCWASITNSRAATCCAAQHQQQQGKVVFYQWLLIAALVVTIIALQVVIMAMGRTIAAAADPAAVCGGGGGGALSSSAATTTSKYNAVTYDPSIAALTWNPFDLQATDLHHPDAALLSPSSSSTSSSSIGPNFFGGDQQLQQQQQPILGYMMQPDIVNGTAVFVAEGDLYWTRLSFAPISDDDPNNNNNHNDDDEKKNNSMQQRPIAAVRLTTTVGNVRTPKINPAHPYLVAFTATYQSRRDVYLLDLRPTAAAAATDEGSSSSSSSSTNTAGGSGNRPAQRLTYFDSAYGVATIAGWSADGTALIFGSGSNQVGLRDLRLYEIALEQPSAPVSSSSSLSPPLLTSSSPPPSLQVLETRPIPLAQATEGVRVPSSLSSSKGSSSGCLFFVRYKQGSHTVRYVGGTVEQLWAYCDGEATAVPVTADYAGTSKSPSMFELEDGRAFLLFLSDRSPANASHGRSSSTSTTTSSSSSSVSSSSTKGGSGNNKWRATSMNLWAAPLPTAAELYAPGKAFVLPNTVQLTRVSCQFGGMALQEYAVDPVTGHVLLRIGADLHHLAASEVRAALASAAPVPSSGPRSPPPRSVGIPPKLPIQVVSDFHEQQERLIRVDMLQHLSGVDVFETDFDSTALLLTLRGQVWVAPVLEENTADFLAYQGSGQNIPQRRYRVIPGAMTGGSIRVLAALHVPLYAAAASASAKNDSSNNNNINSGRRLSLVLATDPLSPTAEHAFYMVEVQADSVNSFADLRHLPDPFVGGHVNGGSTKEGGLGSVDAKSVVVSPCGRRFAWTDTDDRVCVMSMPIYVNKNTSHGFQCLPSSNEMGEPMAGTLSNLKWSPGGRYLGVQHNALNQFNIISIVDCGDPEASAEPGTVADIQIGQISQVTPSRFNSYDMYWGKSTFDIFLSALVKSLGLPTPDEGATTLYFISDRDIMSDVTSPWGSRAPSPHFPSLDAHVYALPLSCKRVNVEQVEPLTGLFSGGGTMEVFKGDLEAYEEALKSSAPNPSSVSDGPRRNLKAYFTAKLSRSLKGRKLSDQEKHSVIRYLEASDTPTLSPLNATVASPFPKDADLDLPTNDPMFARRAYRMARIPKGKYVTIVSQTQDDGSLVLIDKDVSSVQHNVKFFSTNPFPSDVLDIYTVSGVSRWGLSTSRKHLYFVSSSGKTSVVGNSAAGVASFIRDIGWSQHQADIGSMAISVWPALEYRQMYSDAWRLMRDFFYDSNIHNVDWKAVFTRYEPLVQRCGKREELDDVIGQMAAETSALHSFVYGAEYSSPDLPPLEPASLGASMKRAPEWKGYMVTEIPEPDPDFDLVDGVARYCPISNKALRSTGQKGLQVGDVIVALNGESVMLVPDINMMLRGAAGRSVLLEVLRLQSGNISDAKAPVTPESVVVVPISAIEADGLRYNAWEWKTSELAKELAKKAGFTVGYVHMQAMNQFGEDAFARGYFPDHDKDALIIDVRHNTGGNIDSWILDMLQRKAWMYWAGRASDKRYGELDWDEQFAFRGKVVVLVDEHTSSNGEGVARGISELGLGRIIGTRTWGGGIWGSSVNNLVDGGIATAPQWGIFNDKLGWGGGVEMTGVSPDIEVDNDPRMAFDGRDLQLERAISELKAWLKKEPVPAFQTPGDRPDMSLHNDDCPV